MNEFFINVLNNALVASVLILVLIVVRLFLKKVPKAVMCLMWLLVAVKLVLPINIESAISLIPSAQPIPHEIEYATRPNIQSGVNVINETINPILEKNFSPTEVVTSINPIQVALFIGDTVWKLGMICMLAYAMLSYLVLRSKVKIAIKEKDNVYKCDELDSPFILGVVRPRIYIPSGLEEEVKNCVLEHEKAHLARLDHIWKPLGFIILAVYWFNPLCWIAYILFCKDIEMACDQKATREKDNLWKAMYCQALLSCSVNRKMITACPVAFGEVGVKERVKMISKYKKPTVIILITSVIVCITVGCCFMTNPKKDSKEAKVSSTESATEVDNNTNEGEKNDTTNIIAATVPSLWLQDSAGADSVELLYADEEKFIFSGYFGLFVYDTVNNDFIRSVDLEPIGCNSTQGDNYCEIKASADGSRVYLHPMREEDMYVYCVEENHFLKEKYDLAGVELFEIPNVDDLEYDDPQHDEKIEEYDRIKKYWISAYDGIIGGLYYVRLDDELQKTYPMFKPEEYADAKYWDHDEIKDIVKAEITIDEHIYVIEDKAVLEELSAAIRNSTEIPGGSGCDFSSMMYLTNSKGEKGMIAPAIDSCEVYLTGDRYCDLPKGFNILDIIKNHGIKSVADSDEGETDDEGQHAYIRDINEKQVVVDIFDWVTSGTSDAETFGFDMVNGSTDETTYSFAEDCTFSYYDRSDGTTLVETDRAGFVKEVKERLQENDSDVDKYPYVIQVKDNKIVDLCQQYLP